MINLLNIHIDWSAVNAFTLTVGAIGIIIVFAALVVLSVLFTQMPKIIDFFKTKDKKSTKKDKKDKVVEASNEPTKPTEDGPITGEVSAAISLALHMYYNDLHDYESSVVTMEDTKVRRQSAWSSKALTVKSLNK